MFVWFIIPDKSFFDKAFDNFWAFAVALPIVLLGFLHKNDEKTNFGEFLAADFSTRILYNGCQKIATKNDCSNDFER